MTSTFQINHKAFSALRLEGAGWLDYADFKGSEYFDDKAWSEFLSRVSQKEADLLWLSGIREDSALYKVLESRADDGYLIEGESSLILDCHQDGFDAWYGNSSSKAKKKVRHTENKQSAFVKAGGSIDTRQANPEDIQAFLNLQYHRANAEGSTLDAFKEDPYYSAFLYDLAANGELSTVVMELNQDSVGMMLFHHEPNVNDALSIINQGFDPAYSEYAPGFIMQLTLIKLAHDNGACTVDYLKGAEPYKRLFANRELKLYKYMKPLRVMDNAEWEGLKKFGEAYVE
jgi:hypothetical protein